MQDIIRQLLAELGEDPSREGLLDTPKRVEKSLRFLTNGYAADVDAVLNNALFTVDYNEMVIVKDIDFYSLCEHHLLPFFGRCHVAYIPAGPGRRPEQNPPARRDLRPPAAGAGTADQPDCRNPSREDPAARRGVVVEASHLCMSMRGVEKQNSVAVTSAMLGVFQHDARTRMEFLDLIKRPDGSTDRTEGDAAGDCLCECD